MCTGIYISVIIFIFYIQSIMSNRLYNIYAFGLFLFHVIFCVYLAVSFFMLFLRLILPFLVLLVCRSPLRVHTMASVFIVAILAYLFLIYFRDWKTGKLPSLYLSSDWFQCSNYNFRFSLLF